jgi:gliding motility-associated-like protein
MQNNHTIIKLSSRNYVGIKLIGIVFFFFVCLVAKATHQVGGYISFKCLGGTTYQVTITDYTNTYQTSADRDAIRLYYGDGTSDSLPRLNGPPDANGYPGGVHLCNYSGSTALYGARKINIYQGIHTYPGPGVYRAWMVDPDRMEYISNIPGSVNVEYYMYSILIIGSISGLCNNSPVISNPPVCINGCKGQCFYYNPGAYSPDGDSLSYSLGQSLTAGTTAEWGVCPLYNNEGATVDPVTGTLSWCSPTDTNIYNFVILITSLRKVNVLGKKIVLPMDTVELELEVKNEPCSDPAPIVNSKDTCVVAGSDVSINYKAFVSPSHPLSVTYSGEPFSLSPPATFASNSPANPLYATFQWQTNCPEVRENPYPVTVKAYYYLLENYGPPQDTAFFTGIGTSQITVVGPAPPHLDATVTGATVCLHWGPSPCLQAAGYNIYRHTNCYAWKHGYCETGVPSYTGYTLIGTTSSINDTTFCDSNSGEGLSPGVYYSYIVDATYPLPDGSISYASPDTCVEIKRNVPVLTNVSVTQTSPANGIMFVRWAKPILGPDGLDTLQYPGPYRYVLSRATGLTGAGYIPLVAYTPAYFKPPVDTTFSDVSLNTQQDAYNYKVDFYYTDSMSSAYKLVGSSSKASSIFLSLKRGNATIYLNWNYAVPWNNDTFHVYRRDTTATFFHFIGNSHGNTYTDTAGLKNGKQYCYYVESVSAYSDTTVLHPLFDSSQIVCGVPKDTLPPCTPVLKVAAKCNLFEDSLIWTDPDNSCPKANKVVYYQVYYTPTEGGDMSIIATITNPQDTIFVNANLASIAGCYAVIAVDSFGHQTLFNIICVDNCPQYQLPTVFTPNGDGINDLFTPIPPYRYVQSIDINIYNRWGQIMFHTNDPMINWNGNDQHTGKPCPDGVYYYVCTVNEIRVQGIKPLTLHGYVQLLRGK